MVACPGTCFLSPCPPHHTSIGVCLQRTVQVAQDGDNFRTHTKVPRTVKGKTASLGNLDHKPTADLRWAWAASLRDPH